MKKIFSTSLLLLILFCGFSQKKTNNMPIDKDKFFIKELNYRDFSFKKLSEWDTYIDKLQLVDSCDYIYAIERQHCLSSEYYYYAIIDTTNYYSYVYFYFGNYQEAFVLVNYDKKGRYIDDVMISSRVGSEYFYYNSDGVFVSDSVILRTKTDGFSEWICEESISKDVILDLMRYKIVIKKDGHIQTKNLSYPEYDVWCKCCGQKLKTQKKKLKLQPICK